jgi:DNA-3-methyladenine glycosylase II
MTSRKAILHLKKDPKMAKIINQIGTYKIKTRPNRYQSLVEIIITQQLSGLAAKAISTKFRKIYHPQRTFPKPYQVIDTPYAKLRKAGLSKMKISYIKEISKKIESKELPMRSFSKMSDEDIIQNLTEIRGIGRWSAEMFLIFTLGRLDILPVGDLGIKKGFQKLYSLEYMPEEKEMIALAERWRPYRTVATWYLWKSLQEFDEIG